jgi:hypothetical protein
MAGGNGAGGGIGSIDPAPVAAYRQISQSISGLSCVFAGLDAENLSRKISYKTMDTNNDLAKIGRVRGETSRLPV